MDTLKTRTLISCRWQCISHFFRRTSIAQTGLEGEGRGKDREIIVGYQKEIELYLGEWKVSEEWRINRSIIVVFREHQPV